MDDGGEALLQVDALGQAVGGDQHVRAVAVGELGDAAFALGGWQLAGDAATCTGFLRCPARWSRCSAT